MRNQEDSIKRLAEAVTELVKFVPTTKDELTEWYDRAQVIMDDGDMMTNAPHFLWHYFSDADIRMKEPDYAEIQNERVNNLIKYLNRGVSPSDDEI
jgi:hypothetical protein